MSERKTLVSRWVKHMSIRRQCHLPSVNRSSLYYKPCGEKPENLKIMRIMDGHASKHPAEGVNSMVLMLKNHGLSGKSLSHQKTVKENGPSYSASSSLSKLDEAVYMRPSMLQKVNISHANQAWSVDITCIPMQKGCMCCFAIMDIYSRNILGWGISNSLVTPWYLTVLEDTIKSHGKPEITNSDQGSQFTSAMGTNTLKKMGIQISMDGRGSAIVNRWIEHFWRTLKYKYIYLNPPANGLELSEGVKGYIDYYNHQKTYHTSKEIVGVRYRKSMKKQQESRMQLLIKKLIQVV